MKWFYSVILITSVNELVCLLRLNFNYIMFLLIECKVLRFGFQDIRSCITLSNDQDEQNLREGTEDQFHYSSPTKKKTKHKSSITLNFNFT